jgi:hypothetical protein
MIKVHFHEQSFVIENVSNSDDGIAYLDSLGNATTNRVTSISCPCAQGVKVSTNVCREKGLLQIWSGGMPVLLASP